jgi:NhaA family Na+:H+ antiporter
MRLAAVREFFEMEAAGGVMLIVAAALAILVANSPLAAHYQAFLDVHLAIRLDSLAIDKPLVLWINDGLMAVFFLLVGLEIKREFIAGELSTRAQAGLPFIAALGGMAVPALIFAAINMHQPANLNGWAIPAATDIAFAISALSLVSSRVPLSLKVLLTAVAIIDDLGSIIIIAVFYTADLSVLSLTLAGLALIGLVLLNVFNVDRLAPYVLLGAVLWVCVLKSGVHATLAGVALAMAIPLRPAVPGGSSMLKRCEHSLHPWVAFGILPLFGFVNAGVSFAGMGWHSLIDPLTLGIAAGLFVGKQIGIFGATWASIRIGLASKPDGATWAQIYGIALLCGIGFTMSLFIGGLAWPHTDYDAQVRLGVIVGSLLSALLGVAWLAALPRTYTFESQPTLAEMVGSRPR